VVNEGTGDVQKISSAVPESAILTKNAVAAVHLHGNPRATRYNGTRVTAAAVNLSLRRGEAIVCFTASLARSTSPGRLKATSSAGTVWYVTHDAGT
jgi:hypothetical protein